MNILNIFQLEKEKSWVVVRSNGDKHWYCHGKKHRSDGPAIERKTKSSWYLNDIPYPFDVWIDKLAIYYGDEHAIKMKLKWAAQT